MVFSSAVFVFLFLPLTYVLCLLIPGILAKNIFLTVMSLIFYAFGEPVYVLLMIASMLGNYWVGRLLGPHGLRCRKTVIICAVAANLMLLGVFKYAAFGTEILNGLTGWSIPLPQIALPIGISFYTFQSISYIVDVYRQPEISQKDFIHVALYISFFPQLIAGPILQYSDVDAQISNRRMTVDGTFYGIGRFILGLSKKMLISNVAGSIADSLFALRSEQVSLPLAWLAAVAYCLQIYFDFSGYSDMAIGLGKMFGFSFPENFNNPYAAESMRDFWRRWHISLSSWFRDYLYIPLGGNRKGKARTALNRLIVFACTGLWHGASWNFVLWGLWNGFFVILEDFRSISIERIRWKPLRRLLTLMIVAIGFVLFRAETLSQAMTMIGAMFGARPLTSTSLALCVQQLSPYHCVILLLGMFVSVPHEKMRAALCLKPAGKIVCVASLGAMFFLCMISLASATYNPFIYFRF